MTEYLAKRFKNDVLYLDKLFGKANNMEGIILKLSAGKGYDNYTSNVGNPMKEDTLIVGDDYNNVFLFFKHSVRKPSERIFEGVTTMPRFSYTTGCLIHKKLEPADLPCHLEGYVFGNIEEALNSLQIEGNFFSRNYHKGGMVPIKDVRNNTEWKPEYEQLVQVKRVHVCKSCRSKARKGCCSEYSSGNRVMIKMVIGWSK